MKIQTATFLTALSLQEIKKLTTEVKETIAVKDCNKKIFTSLDLWKIQKQKRNFSIRSFA